MLAIINVGASVQLWAPARVPEGTASAGAEQVAVSVLERKRDDWIDRVKHVAITEIYKHTNLFQIKVRNVSI